MPDSPGLETLGTPTVTGSATLKNFVNVPPPGRWEFCVEGQPNPGGGETVVPGSVVAVVSFNGGPDVSYPMVSVGGPYKTGKQTSPLEPMQAKIRASFQYTNESAAQSFTAGACPF